MTLGATSSTSHFIVNPWASREASSCSCDGTLFSGRRGVIAVKSVSPTSYLLYVTSCPAFVLGPGILLTEGIFSSFTAFIGIVDKVSSVAEITTAGRLV